MFQKFSISCYWHNMPRKMEFFYYQDSNMTVRRTKTATVTILWCWQASAWMWPTCFVTLKICTVPHQWRKTKLKSLTTNAPAFLGKNTRLWLYGLYFFNTAKHLCKVDTQYYIPRTEKKKLRWTLKFQRQS